MVESHVEGLSLIIPACFSSLTALSTALRSAGIIRYVLARIECWCLFVITSCSIPIVQPSFIEVVNTSSYSCRIESNSRLCSSRQQFDKSDLVDVSIGVCG